MNTTKAAIECAILADAWVELTGQVVLNNGRGPAKRTGKGGFSYLRSLWLLHCPAERRVSAYRHG